MTFLDTLKQGVTGYTPDEQSQIAKAKEDAKKLSKQLKAEARQKKLDAKLEQIRNSPKTQPIVAAERREKLKATVKTLGKKVYNSVSSFGVANEPSQAASTQPQPQRSYNPFESMMAAPQQKPTYMQRKTPKQPKQLYDPFQSLGVFGNDVVQSNAYSSPKGQKKSKRQPVYDPWQNLR
jgi:hypothetical protein